MPASMSNRVMVRTARRTCRIKTWRETRFSPRNHDIGPQNEKKWSTQHSKHTLTHNTQYKQLLITRCFPDETIKFIVLGTGGHVGSQVRSRRVRRHPPWLSEPIGDMERSVAKRYYLRRGYVGPKC